MGCEDCVKFDVCFHIKAKNFSEANACYYYLAKTKPDNTDGCDICNGKASVVDLFEDTHTHVISEGAIWHYDSELGIEGESANFCFMCGRKIQ